MPITLQDIQTFIITGTVANYSALPAANLVPNQYYWVLNEQGTWWLPGSLGGTYYNKGIYRSNGTIWEFQATPANASQATVDAGTNNDQFLTPLTFDNASKWLNYTLKPIVQSSSFIATNGLIYHATATLTATDPTPIEGQGFYVLVLNGAATVGGVSYALKGTLIKRVYEGGVWANYTYYNSEVKDYSSATTSGFSSFTRKEIDLHENGESVTCTFWVEGPGTGTVTEIVLPYNSVNNASGAHQAISNGAGAVIGRCTIGAGTNILTLSATFTGGTYSGTGNRRASGFITFKRDI